VYVQQEYGLLLVMIQNMEHDQYLEVINCNISLASVRIAAFAFAGKGFDASIFR
jgi:hypothetical protein